MPVSHNFLNTLCLQGLTTLHTAIPRNVLSILSACRVNIAILRAVMQVPHNLLSEQRVPHGIASSELSYKFFPIII